MKRILIVEDERGIAIMEKNYLDKNGFTCDIAGDGIEAIKMFSKEKYDLIVLDLMIPKLPGEEVLKAIREESKVPVILVTAKVDEKDVLKAFRNGGDDYLKKPFSALELVERVKSILRRTDSGPETHEIHTDDGRLTYDFTNSRLLLDGKEVVLTKNELMILNTIFSNPNKTFTRNEIIEISFGYDYEAYDRAIDTHIKNIRQKIEEDPKNPKYVKTIYGLGYKAGEMHEA